MMTRSEASVMRLSRRHKLLGGLCFKLCGQDNEATQARSVRGARTPRASGYRGVGGTRKAAVRLTTAASGNARQVPRKLGRGSSKRISTGRCTSTTSEGFEQTNAVEERGMFHAAPSTTMHILPSNFWRRAGGAAGEVGPTVLHEGERQTPIRPPVHIRHHQHRSLAQRVRLSTAVCPRAGRSPIKHKCFRAKTKPLSFPRLRCN